MPPAIIRHGKGAIADEKYAFDYQWKIDAATLQIGDKFIPLRSPSFGSRANIIFGYAELNTFDRTRNGIYMGELSVHFEKHPTPFDLTIDPFLTDGCMYHSIGSEQKRIRRSGTWSMSRRFSLDASTLKHYIKNNSLTMMIGFVVAEPALKAIYQIGRKDPRVILSKHFGSLLDNGRHADLTITVGSRKFPVHKVVLERSSVFAAMFDHDLKETKTNNIDIVDISEDVMEEFLQYLYTDETTKIEDMAMDLLYAAEKYDMQHLKSLCAQYLVKDLDVNNAIKRLVIADRYYITDMKDAILKFIGDNKKKVMATRAYKTLKETHVNLAQEVMHTEWDYWRLYAFTLGPPPKR